MSIYSHVDSGTSFHRSRYTKSISNVMTYDCQFHQLIPVLKRFCLPGDIWRVGGDVLVRFLPMRTPTLTPNTFRVRYFFVPLRLVEEDTELIITGSKDGKLYAPTDDHPDTPVFDNFVTNANKVTDANAYKVLKHSFWDYMNVQLGDYENIKNAEFLPARYWHLGYLRIFWDYYRDENLSNISSYGDFNDFASANAAYGADVQCGYSYLAKDYFTSALPWQLKGTAPRIDVTGSGRIDFSQGNIITGESTPDFNIGVTHINNPAEYYISTDGTSEQQAGDKVLEAFGNSLGDTINITSLGFTLDDLRTMAAQTRIFERLARAGSRYTEYLRSNFGTSPADGTLQRAQYLGGWKVPIVTTEVLQTAEATQYGSDTKTPIGTMRGHGITRGGNRINTFICKEFGMLFGIAEVRPKVQYSTGINRQLSYKRRWDFFNPSLQHLSEQEVRNGELFVNFTPDADTGEYDNDNTFGFQAYANELRSYNDEVVGDMRDGLSDWNQALSFASRPNLNQAFIQGNNHLGSFNRPFVYQGSDGYPIIVQFSNNLDVYRPMVKYANPGLVDHL